MDEYLTLFKVRNPARPLAALPPVRAVRERTRVLAESAPNLLIEGHNLTALQALDDTATGAEIRRCGGFALIYLDPPFGVGTNFSSIHHSKSLRWSTVAYEDYLEDGKALDRLYELLLLMYTWLSPTGCLFLHCDWRLNAKLRLILDHIFGEENFQNEIVWSYRSGGSSSKRFARKHDTIYFYTKGPGFIFKTQKEKSYNRDAKPYRFKGVEEFEDEQGWYTLSNMRDVWDIPMVGRTSREREGYPTQKPEALLKRIIDTVTEPGDWILDPFSGSGTTVTVAEKSGRRWIGIDCGKQAINTAWRRLNRTYGSGAFESATREVIIVHAAPEKDQTNRAWVSGENGWACSYDQSKSLWFSTAPVVITAQLLAALRQLFGSDKLIEIFAPHLTLVAEPMTCAGFHFNHLPAHLNPEMARNYCCNRDPISAHGWGISVAPTTEGLTDSETATASEITGFVVELHRCYELNPRSPLAPVGDEPYLKNGRICSDCGVIAERQEISAPESNLGDIIDYWSIAKYSASPHQPPLLKRPGQGAPLFAEDVPEIVWCSVISQHALKGAAHQGPLVSAVIPWDGDYSVLIVDRLGNTWVEPIIIGRNI